MRYLVGNIEILIHPSTSRWTSRTRRSINRQLDGFQKISDDDNSANYQINLFDFGTLPVNIHEAQNIVPDYCFFTAGIYVDLQNQLAVQKINTIMNVWCSERCKGVSIPFLIQILLISQGKSFVHAAGVDVRGKGVLLAAFGGIGKTAFISQATKQQDVKILGDDLIIATENGTIEPYLRPFALYQYHRQLFPDYFSTYPVQYRPQTLSWRIYNRARKTMGDFLNLDWYQPQHIVRTGYIPISPTKLFPAEKLAKSPSVLTEIYLLTRSSLVDKLVVQPISPGETAQFMLNVIQHELHNQLRFWLSWLTHTKRSYGDVILETKGILESAVNSAHKHCLIQIPANMPVQSVGKELVKIVIE